MIGHFYNAFGNLLGHFPLSYLNKPPVFGGGDPYPSSWVNLDSTINCGGIVYCSQTIPCEG